MCADSVVPVGTYHPVRGTRGVWCMSRLDLYKWSGEYSHRLWTPCANILALFLDAYGPYTKKNFLEFYDVLPHAVFLYKRKPHEKELPVVYTQPNRAFYTNTGITPKLIPSSSSVHTRGFRASLTRRTPCWVLR